MRFLSTTASSTWLKWFRSDEGNDFIQGMQYELKPSHCLFYKVFGHDGATCTMNPTVKGMASQHMEGGLHLGGGSEETQHDGRDGSKGDENPCGTDVVGVSKTQNLSSQEDLIANKSLELEPNLDTGGYATSLLASVYPPLFDGQLVQRHNHLLACMQSVPAGSQPGITDPGLSPETSIR
ncbi:hypothetical protein NE237_029991 [Protea cynaroides]|uniref:Uncharacterized protein n=1 Tax=Protea cynaroides TaxID=273540 RepID=A0A9Q0GT78_9MAGN|nr:hypothetical protein NE237_029991 [Protea cynaroides]